MKNVFTFTAAQNGRSIVVADSPHSGRVYPADFDHACARDELRQAEDMGVDTLYGFLTQLGIPFLQAEFPRSYIDANRSDAPAKKFLKDGEGDYDGGNSSLVREKINPRSNTPIYDRKLKLSEVFNRAAAYHKPYHDRLRQMLDDTAAREGRVVHLNLHSMPSTMRGGKWNNPYDVIIGIKGGATASPAVAEKLRDLFAAKGYTAAIDISGYSGAEIVKRSGDPAKGRHSLQVEVNRRLYMNENTLMLNANMPRLQSDLKEIMTDFAAWCEKNVPQAPRSSLPPPALKP